MENLLTALEILAAGLGGGIGIALMIMFSIQSKTLPSPEDI